MIFLSFIVYVYLFNRKNHFSKNGEGNSKKIFSVSFHKRRFHRMKGSANTLFFLLLLFLAIWVVAYFFEDSFGKKRGCNLATLPPCSVQQKTQCIDGVWNCLPSLPRKKCDPSKAKECNDGSESMCVNGVWTCPDDPSNDSGECDSAGRMLCPGNVWSVCVDGEWSCPLDETIYTGSVFNDTPQTSKWVNPNLVCQRYSDTSGGDGILPSTLYLNNFSTIVIDISDPSYQSADQTGFTYNGGYFTTGQSMYYSQYTWDSQKNPSPIIGLDLYAQFYYPQSTSDTSHDDAICDVLLFMYDPTTYDSGGAFQYIMYTVIFSGTWAQYKNKIDACENIQNAVDLLPKKGMQWNKNPHMEIENKMTVAFCFGFFSREDLWYINSYTGLRNSYTLRQIQNNTSQGRGGSCLTKDPLQFRIYNAIS